jgi:hypothetical protein
VHIALPHSFAKFEGITRLGKVGKRGFLQLPLYEKVSFTTKLQRGNRFQVSKYVRWKYKLETNQTLRITVTVIGVWSTLQIFLARMNQDGRIVIPKTIMTLMQTRDVELAGYALKVTLEPF